MFVSSPGLMCVLLGLGSDKDAFHPQDGTGQSVTHHNGTKREEMTRGDQSLSRRHEAKRAAKRMRTRQRGRLIIVNLSLKDVFDL